jgi:cyanophycinase-like exopeptidase
MYNKRRGSAITMTLGKLVLFGSGESLPMGGQVIRRLAEECGSGVVLAMLETPAGFQPNSERVLGEVADFYQSRIRHLHPTIARIPARKRETEYSPDRAEIVRPIAQADILFLGAGSPTYAVRQLKGSLAWQYVMGAWQRGATLVMASAAAIAAGAKALPVYEIFKVGEDLHWEDGLDVVGPFGLPLVVVPHWNNSDGGAELDTSRCFMGEARFRSLRTMLPESSLILGIDENTVVEIDLARDTCRVGGAGKMTVLSRLVERTVTTGEECALSALGNWAMPALPFNISNDIWQEVQQAKEMPEAEVIPPGLIQLLHERNLRRAANDFTRADELRLQIEGEGWEVTDTKEGARLSRKKKI